MTHKHVPGSEEGRLRASTCHLPARRHHKAVTGVPVPRLLGRRGTPAGGPGEAVGTVISVLRRTGVTSCVHVWLFVTLLTASSGFRLHREQGPQTQLCERSPVPHAGGLGGPVVPLLHNCSPRGRKNQCKKTVSSELTKLSADEESPLWCNGLRTWRCCTSSDLIPGLGTFFLFFSFLSFFLSFFCLLSF